MPPDDTIADPPSGLDRPRPKHRMTAKERPTGDDVVFLVARDGEPKITRSLVRPERTQFFRSVFQRHRVFYGMFFIDFDQCKDVNDTLCHLIGDGPPRRVAHVGSDKVAVVLRAIR